MQNSPLVVVTSLMAGILATPADRAFAADDGAGSAVAALHTEAFQSAFGAEYAMLDARFERYFADERLIGQFEAIE
jgi:hypothetical protein